MRVQVPVADEAATTGTASNAAANVVTAAMRATLRFIDYSTGSGSVGPPPTRIGLRLLTGRIADLGCDTYRVRPFGQPTRRLSCRLGRGRGIGAIRACRA